MLTYALGRGLEYYDRCAVDEILEALRQGRRSVLHPGVGGGQERTVPDADRDEGRSHDRRRADLEADGAAGRRHGRGAAVPGGDACRWRWPRAVGRRRPSPPRRMAFLYVPNGAIMSDWTPETEGRRFRAAGDPRAAGPAPGRPAGPQRPDLRQGPRQRRRRRRPRPRLVGVPDRLPGAEDRRRQLPLGDLGRPGRRHPARRADPAPLAGARHRALPRRRQLRQRLFLRLRAHDLLAVADLAAADRGRSPARLRPPLRRAAQRPRPPASGTGCGPACSTRSSTTPQGLERRARRRRPPEARPVPLLRPRAGAADRPRRDPAAGPAARRTPSSPRHARPTCRSTSA